MARLTFPRLTGTDVIAGASVAMVLIPQSLAYAELAGLPPHVGLFASALPLVVFCVFASSPYLQTGPVAVTSLLTLAVLPADVDNVPALAALMALMVGVIRVVLGVARLGTVVRLMSSPVVMGFTSGAAVVIMASQLPKALGLAPSDGVLGPAVEALTRPSDWSMAAVGLSIVTALLFIGGRRLNPLFPGVLVAVILAIVYSQLGDYDGATIENIPAGLPRLNFDLPWSEIPTILLGATIIALVGFAEPASIARTFANETGQKWDANQEMFASGLANAAAAFSGAYPVGGSFSRSSVNKLAGAQTRWSGGVTGLIVLAFLPFAQVLEPLPTAVLGAIVLGAVSSLVKPIKLIKLWQRSRSQALLAWATAAATLAFTPRVERAIVLGIALTLALHFTRRFSMDHTKADDGTVTVQPVGLLWMATDSQFKDGLKDAADQSSGDVIVDFARSPFLNASVIDAMSGVAEDLSESGGELTWSDPPAGTERMLNSVHQPEDES